MTKTTKKSADRTPDHLFFIRPETLTDGSKVFNVHFCDTVFECASEDDAEALAEELSDAINLRTDAWADIVDER